DEGAPSERPSEAQPTPSPAPTSEIPIEPQTDSSPTHTSEVPIEQQNDPSPRPTPPTIDAESIPEAKIDKKEILQEKMVQRDPLFDEIPEDTLDHMETENAQDVGRTRELVGEEKENDENMLSTKDVLSTDKEKVSTDRPIVSTDGSKVSTDRQIEGTDEQIESTDEQRKGTKEQIESTDEQRKGTEEGSATLATQTPTSTIFGDDETIAKVLLN
ncbi:hypothetical protein Tco_0049404, partial [Tanacetum coccineum]